MAVDIVGQKDDVQVTRAAALVMEGTSHPIRHKWVEEADLCYQFRDQDQLSTEERKILKERNQPDVQYNKCIAAIERTLGQYTRQRTVNTIVGRNQPVDDGLASVLADLHRFTDQDTNYLFAEKEMVRDGLTGGVGYVEVGVESETLGRPRIFIDEQDPFTIAVDPFCRRYDWNAPRGGARYVLRFPWIDLSEGQARWPKYASKLEYCLDNSLPAKNVFANLDPKVTQELQFQFYDKERRLIRPVEILFKERREQEVVITPYGILGDEYEPALLKRALKLVPGARKAEMKRDCLYVMVICGDVLIQKAVPHPYKTSLYTIVPYYCGRKRNGQPYGRVLRMIDPNREINSRRSRALYMLNNRQTIYEKGAINDQTKLADELSKADGQVVLENGKFDKFMMRENQDIGQANLQMLQEAKAELSDIQGEDYLAPSGEMRSGAGVQQQQLPYHLSQVDIFDNLRQTRKLKSQLVTALIQNFYDEEMVFQITDDEGKAQTVKVSKEQFQGIKNRIFDYIIKEQPDYANAHEEAFQTLATTLPQIAQFGPQWGKILVMNSELREKEKTLKIIEQMEESAQTAPEPKVSLSIVWTELDAIEKAAWAVKFGMPDLAQYEQQSGRRPARDDKHEADITKVQITQGVKAGLDARKLDVQEQTALADAQLRLREMNDAKEMALQAQTTDTGEGVESASDGTN